MQLVIRDADLGAEAELEAVGEAGGGVDHHRGGIDFAQEAHGVAVVVGDNRVGVIRAVAFDVVHRCVDVGDDLHRKDGREVFGGPVFFAGGFHCWDELQAGGVAAQFHALVGVHPGQARQHGRGDCRVHQQCFHGVAGAVALGLGVVGYGYRHAEVSMQVDVHVADAVEVFDHRDFRFPHQALDQALAAARDDDVHVFGHGDEFAHGGAVGGFDHLHGIGRQAGGGQACAYAGGDGLIGVQGF